MRLENSLYLLLIIPVLIILYLKFKKFETKLSFPSIEKFASFSWKSFFRYLLRGIAIILIIFALARPQHYSEREIVHGEGIDIMILLDISTSMLARDFPPNRVEAAKRLTKDFISKRPNDRIGLTLYAAEAINWVPLTLDHHMLKKRVSEVELELIDERYFGGRGLQAETMLPDGTAIGTAIAVGTNRMKEVETDERIIVLVTDGINNKGEITPEMAAEMADSEGIKIYTIGIGSPVTRGDFEEIDEQQMIRISKKTGGKYFRAYDEEELQKIYDTISELEPSKIESTIFAVTREYFHYLLWPVVAVLFIELIIFDLYMKRIP
ncbi:MAG: VWA domain-containing protein [Candidatus Muiribacteriota bacterium]